MYSGGVMAKSTTLWVGKIAPTVEAQLIRDVLEACGPLKEWKPALDPATGGIKGFGFATFRDAEGVLVALAVLNGLTLDGQALALKCNSATEQYIKWFKDSKSKDGGAGNSENKLVGNGNESAAREKVSELVKGRASVAPPVAVTDAADAANEFLASLGQGSAQPGQENAETRRFGNLYFVNSSVLSFSGTEYLPSQLSILLSSICVQQGCYRCEKTKRC